tara:strand:+ start:344 stop:883 length:540 start_codon:yes stop_codon:yes gene_type:complete
MSGILTDNTGRASGLIKAAGGGGLLQLKQTQITDTSSRNSTTWGEIDADFEVGITPTLATSKILVQVFVHGSGTNNSFLRLVREEVGESDLPIALGDMVGSNRVPVSLGDWQHASGDRGNFCALNWLDAPATTNALIYKLEHFSHSTFYINYTHSDADNNSSSRAVSTITASEIAVGVL